MNGLEITERYKCFNFKVKIQVIPVKAIYAKSVLVNHSRKLL